MVGLSRGRRCLMFRLSKKSDYGLIALKHLAQHNEESISAREIAAHYHIPAELLAKVLQRLVQKGLLASQQGINGGYILARDPATISIADVVGKRSVVEDQSKGREGVGRHFDLRTCDQLEVAHSLKNSAQPKIEAHDVKRGNQNG